MTTRKYEIFRQVFPVLIGALTGVSFGTTLGWPSVVYPLLLDPENSPILITWDQSSLIAGFMMEGNIIGTVFSSIKLFGSRIGVLIACTCQVSGWIAMYYAQDIPGIGVGRVLVGFGNGFCLGQLKMFVRETCDPNIEKVLMQYMPLAMNIGVVVVFSLGSVVSFRVLSIICIVIPTIALFLFAVIPKKDYIQPQDDNITTVTSTIDTKPTVGETQTNPEQVGFIAGLKDKDIRKCLFFSWLLIFIPQYAGGSANLVYSQIVHMAALNPHPQICSIIYSVVFFLSNFAAFTYTNKFPRKPIAIASCIICSLLLCSVCFYFYFMVDLLEVSPRFVWSPLVLLCIYNIFHSVGLNIIPVLYVADRYPKNSKLIGSKFYVMYFSLSAVLSTKIFQVLFTKYGMHTSYAFLSAVSFAGAILIAFFVNEPSDKNFRPMLIKVEGDLKNQKCSQDVIANETYSGKYTPYCHSYYNYVDVRDEVIPAIRYPSNCRNVGSNTGQSRNYLV